MEIGTNLLAEVLRSEHEFREFKAEETIFKVGDPGDFTALVLTGRVSIRKQGKPVSVVNAGSIFGEMALIDGKPRSADAVALTACRIARISERQFDLLVARTPRFALFVMRTLTERLRSNLET
jgi:CRP-like cAMP-binding protein